MLLSDGFLGDVRLAQALLCGAGFEFLRAAAGGPLTIFATRRSGLMPARPPFHARIQELRSSRCKEVQRQTLLGLRLRLS